MVNTRSEASRAKEIEKPTPTNVKKSDASRRPLVKSPSARSSVKARRARLILEAAEQMALLKMELIEKKLAADLAKLDSCGSQSLADGEPGEEKNASRIEEWVKTQRVTSCHDDALRPAQRQDAVLQQLDNAGPSQLGNVQPNQSGTDDGTMHMLACALKDLGDARKRQLQPGKTLRA